MAKIAKKYEIKIIEDGKVIDYVVVGKKTAILVQNVLDRRTKSKTLKD